MSFQPNDLVLAKYDCYPPWPSKIAPTHISEELLNRSNKEGIVVMFYGEELTYGIIENESDITYLNTEITPETDDQEWLDAFFMAKENKTDFPMLDPPTKKELKMIEKRLKRKEIPEKINEPINLEENKEKEIKEVNNGESLKEEEEPINENIKPISKEEKENKEKEETKKLKTESQSEISHKEKINFDDELIKKSLNSTIPGLSVKEESIYKKFKKNTSLFLKAFLKRANKKKYIKIKKDLCKILIKYPKETLRTNKTIHKVERMSKERILRNGLFTPLVNLYLNDWMNDPLEVKMRCEALIKRIVE